MDIHYRALRRVVPESLKTVVDDLWYDIQHLCPFGDPNKYRESRFAFNYEQLKKWKNQPLIVIASLLEPSITDAEDYGFDIKYYLSDTDTDA